ncbi:NADH-quinone oxidoreductase subunit L [Alicyclobacillus cycloheptanicus]|uniref:NADH-quinone oxidoreductase subunit L n=1 Tax=Alicyclobacillus cycloheptanicus TaxID=1457 RepID=A0ABT9XHA2_9BACL|nr:NADH-quinone oxidoreductase subunit L [Alicyclobacillus cycloheptanicus]MDQ0189409.1 NADH-quinone oxidoreductase subunit L [Alicyclobacillus cycloheptanicus]WDM02283.1 NADH-quinone oxidoreductase subunit L [Alicyclobacillus cycloheptanicus]
MAQTAWLVPLLPLVAYVVLLALGRRVPEWLAAGVSVVLTFVSFLLSIAIFRGLGTGPQGSVTYQFHWLSIGSRTIEFGWQVTHLNALMLVVVTLVSTLVLLFSKGYMHGDERFHVFYQYLNLFVFSMLALVISPNLLQLYIFWEMVGLCSYLLVGFWFFKPEAALAAKKSFIVTRIGDAGLFVGIILLFLSAGSFDYDTIFQAAASNHLALGWISGSGLVTLACLLIFLGAVGKSAQFPLHVWLPDAMEGPTPVSALIHAATMVAAGVYLVARVYPLFELSHTATTTVAWIGGITALLAALIAPTQRDIKRVIAYSTISQLGYMMMALGVGAYAYGVFHLMTHAFFKALLFLAAGSVIHAVDTQDLFEMGGLWKKLPVTTWTFLAGALALSGIVPFAGFWSKDDILGAALSSGHPVLYWFGLIAAFFTAFYIFRVFFLTFTGVPRDEKRFEHAHEGSWVMMVPLVVLGVFAVIAGFFNSPLNGYGLEKYLFNDYAAAPGVLQQGAGAGAHEVVATIGQVFPENIGLMAISVGVGLLGILLAALMYWRPVIQPAKMASALKFFWLVSNRKFYLDEIYYYVVVGGGKVISAIVSIVDRYIIDGLVNLFARLGYIIGLGLKYTQTGQVQAYGVVAAFGLFLILVIAMFHLGGVF